jgi:hypothetical protein
MTGVGIVFLEKCGAKASHLYGAQTPDKSETCHKDLASPKATVAIHGL